MASPLVRRFAYGAAWNTVATAASRALNLLAMICVARTLGRELTGSLGAVLNTMGMFGVFAGCGLGVATTKFVAEFRRSDPDRAGRIIGCTQAFAASLGAVFAIVCLALSPWLASHVLNASALARPLQIGSALVLCNTIQGVQNAALAGFEAFRAVAIVNTIGGVCALVFVIGGVRLAGLEGALIGFAITAAVQAVVGQIAIRVIAHAESTPISARGRWPEVSSLVKFSLPVAASALTVMPTEWAVTALLVNQPQGYGELGLYSAATQWFNALLLMPMIVGQAALPMLSERWSRGDRRGFVRVMLLSMTSNVAVVVPLVLAGWLLSGWLMTRNGPEFAEGAGVLCVLLTATLVMALQIPVGNSLQASGKTWIGLWMNLGWATAYVCLAAWFVASGAIGVAWARLLAYAAHTVWVFAYVLYIALSKPHIRPTFARSA